MPRTLSAFGIRSIFFLSSALFACAHPPETSDEPDRLDMATPIDASQVVTRKECRPSVAITLAAPIAELRSTSPFNIALTLSDPGGASDAHLLKVVLEQADGTPIKTLSEGPQQLGKLTLQFTPSAEKNLPTGALQLKADIACPTSVAGTPSSTSAKLYAVRLGATQIVVQGGEAGDRLPLMYHAVDHDAGNYFPIPATLATTSFDLPTGESELDAPDGTPRAFPDKPWDDLETPPVDSKGAVLETGYTLPVALKLDSKPQLVFTIGKSAQGAAGTQPTGLDADGMPPIRLVVDGVPSSDKALCSPGGEASVQLADSPVPAIDRVDLPISWHFEWKGQDDHYTPIAGGEQSVTLRFYGVLGNDQGTTAPDLPWVAVVDAATHRIAGKATDAATARSILVQYVYEEMMLTYDRKAGASHYTRYSGSGGWSVASFSLADFLKRAKGSIVNCSDCASILSTYANMIGAKLHYAIIGWNFDLNPILGIGATAFGSPFDSGHLGFNYHAVTSPDATMTIDDATLAVDGDMDPKTAPHTKQLVQNLTGSDYLTRLSPTFGTGTPDYEYDDQITHAR